MSKTLVIWLFNIAILLTVLFSNDQQFVTIYFLTGYLSWPLGVTLVLFMLAGQLMALFIAWWDRAALRRDNRKLRAEAASLRDELTELRHLVTVEGDRE